MRIEQLVGFVEYVRCQSLTEAGKRLFVTPQALSISLKRLEDELGVKLTVKNGSSVSLTEQGKLLLSASEVIASEYKNFMLKLNQMKNEEKKKLTGSLYIYANMLFHSTIIPTLLNDFYINHPEVRIYVFENDSATLYKEFSAIKQEKNVTKIAFCLRPVLKSFTWPDPKGYTFHSIYKGGYYAYAGKGITLHPKESIKKLLKYPMVLYASQISNLQIQGKELKNPVIMSLEEWGRVNITFSTNKLELWRQMLLNQPCIGFVHSFLVKHGNKSFNNLHFAEIKEDIQAELGWFIPTKTNELVDEVQKKIASYMAAFSGVTE